MKLISTLSKGACLLLFLCFSFSANAQLAVNTDGADPDASAMLDVKSTDKGLLIPRMTELEKEGIPSPALGLMVFQTDGLSGFYYHNGSQWVLLGDEITQVGVANIFFEDVVVDGSLCIGTDCNSTESFGFATIKLKENNTRIEFRDTSTDPGDPDNDWMLEANESPNGGLNAFFLTDLTNNQRPFLVSANAGNNAFYVDADGDAGIGLNNPMHKLHVNGNIHADGDITATGTINCASDARLKHNIQPLDNAMSIISELQPKRYHFKSETYPKLNLPTTAQIGLIAQEVQEVVPELVDQKTVTTDEQGTTMEINSVNYIGLVPVLVKGMQEQQAILDEQQATLEPLKAELNELRALKQQLNTLLSAIEATGTGASSGEEAAEVTIKK